MWFASRNYVVRGSARWTGLSARTATDDFFHEAQDCSLRWDPATPPGLLLPAADDIPMGRPELGHPDSSVCRAHTRSVMLWS